MADEHLQEELEYWQTYQAGKGNKLSNEQAAAELEDMDAETLAALKELAGASKGEAEPEKETFSVKIGDKEFTAETQEALEAQVREWAGGKQDETATPGLTAAAKANLGTAKPEETKPADEPKFDLKKYAELFGEDPLAAQDYLAEFSSQTKATKQELETLRGEIRAREQDAFLDFVDASADFPSESQETVAYLEAITRQAKLPVTKRNLQKAWQYMKEQKLAVPKAVEKPAEGTTEKPKVSKSENSGAAAVPPRPRGTGSAGPTGAVGGEEALATKLAQLIENAESTDVLRKEFSKLGFDMPGSLSRLSGTGMVN